jgi:hypothetical protein
MIGNPWGLLALLSVPAILAIHLFRHRFRPRRIAGLFMWATPGKDASAGRRLHRLENTVSLILELLIALLATLYLIDLRFGQSDGAIHQVIVLDSSASMGAVSADYDTAAQARDVIRDLTEASGRQGQISVIASGARPALIVGPAAPTIEVEEALATWTPTGRAHSLAPSYDLARELAGLHGIVHVVTDRIPETRPHDGSFHWHAIGRPASNGAILAARRESAGDEERIFVRVGYRGVEAGSVAVTIREEETVRGSRSLSFPGSGEQLLTFTVPATRGELTVTLNPDALSIDNTARLLPPPVRPIVIANTLPEGPARDAIERLLAAVPDVLPASAEHHAQIVFADPSIDVTGLPDTWWCRIGTPPVPEGTERGEARDLIGPFLMDKSHPLLQNVHLGGVVWGGAHPETGDWIPLISTGRFVLAALEPTRTGISLFLNLDLARSNLQRTSDWPILLSNLIRMRREALPGALRANLRVGDVLPVNLPREPKGEISLQLPNGSTRPIPGHGRVVLSLLDDPGVYRLIDADTELHRFAVNFQDAAESTLLDVHEQDIPPEIEEQKEVQHGEALINPALHFPLLLLLLALFLTNMHILSRGRTAGEDGE